MKKVRTMLTKVGNGTPDYTTKKFYCSEHNYIFIVAAYGA
jgi:hypothetical protein